MYQISKLRKFPNLIHGFSTVDGGNMATLFGRQEANPDEVLIRRKKFLRKLKIDIDECMGMWHQHSDKVDVVEETQFEEFGFQKVAKVDGLITNKKGVFLFMVVADCLPIIIYDPRKKIVALVHAGWKGVDLEIAKNAVAKLKEEYGCDSKDLIVGFGPAARKDSYIRQKPSQLGDLEWEGFIGRINKNEYKIDFVGLARKQLIEAGVPRKNIFDCEIDTIKDKRFFSHYRDKKMDKSDQGRFACVVGMR